jgi:hypothetical protein
VTEWKVKMASEDRLGIAARLQGLYRSDDIARALLDDAAERSYVVARTSVDRIARIAGTTRAKAIELCKLLDDIGVGTYKRAYTKDRDKFPARIHWHYVPRSIGRIAKGEKEELQDIRLEEPDDLAEQGDAIASNGTRQPVLRDFIEHRYPLREGRIVTLRLPINLTKEEADRLSAFIAALAQPG